MNNVQDPANKAKELVLTLGITYRKKVFLDGVDNIKIFTHHIIMIIILAFFMMSFLLALSILIAFKSSHKLFRPLRRLNRAMREIIGDGMKRDLTS